MTDELPPWERDPPVVTASLTPKGKAAVERLRDTPGLTLQDIAREEWGLPPRVRRDADDHAELGGES